MADAIKQEVAARLKTACGEDGFAKSFTIGFDQRLTEILQCLARAGISAAPLQFSPKIFAEGSTPPTKPLREGFAYR